MQEAVNKALVDLLYTLEMQGFGVGWMRGGSVNPMVDDATITVGPGRMIQLPQDGELGFAATQAPIDEVVGAIDRLMKWCAVSNGLPGSSMSVDPTDESGVSKIVGNVELEESRRDDIALWRVYERRLFTIMRAVWNHHNPGRKLSDAATLAVDFADPKPDTSEKDQAATWELLLSMGLISPVDGHGGNRTGHRRRSAYPMQVRDERRLSENKINRRRRANMKEMHQMDPNENTSRTSLGQNGPGSGRQNEKTVALSVQRECGKKAGRDLTGLVTELVEDISAQYAHWSQHRGDRSSGFARPKVRLFRPNRSIRP
jgi:hypothetical protein